MAVYVIAIVSALLVSGVAVLVWVYLICRAVCLTLGGPPPPLMKLDYESAKQTIAYWSQNLPPFFAVKHVDKPLLSPLFRFRRCRAISAPT